MKLENFFISTVIIVGVIILGSRLVSQVEDKYELNDDGSSEFSAISDDLSTIYGYSTDMKDKVQADSIDKDDAYDEATKRAYEAVKKGPFDMLSHSINKTEAMVESIRGVDPVIFTLSKIILTLLAVFAVVYLIFRFIPR